MPKSSGLLRFESPIVLLLLSCLHLPAYGIDCPAAFKAPPELKEMQSLQAGTTFAFSIVFEAGSAPDREQLQLIVKKPKLWARAKAETLCWKSLGNDPTKWSDTRWSGIARIPTNFPAGPAKLVVVLCTPDGQDGEPIDYETVNVSPAAVSVRGDAVLHTDMTLGCEFSKKSTPPSNDPSQDEFARVMGDPGDPQSDWALSRWRDNPTSGMMKKLISLLDSTDPSVAARAAYALQDAAKARPMAGLVRVVNAEANKEITDADLDMANLCSEVVSRFTRNPRSHAALAPVAAAAQCKALAPILRKALQGQPIPGQTEPVQAYFQALETMKVKDAIPDIERWLGHPDPDIRASAERAVAGLRKQSKLDHSSVESFRPVPIEADTTWSGRLILRGKVTVPEGKRLVIAPGSEISMQGYWNAGFEVKGTLVARGTKEAPIKMRARSQKEYWSGIRLEGKSASADISHVELYNGRKPTVGCTGGSLTLQQSRLINDNLNDGGILVTNGCRAVIRDNEITYLGEQKGSARSAINSTDAAPVVENNRISGYGLAIQAADSGGGLRPTMSRNTLTGGTAQLSVRQVQGPPPGLPQVPLERKWHQTDGSSESFSVSPSGRYIVRHRQPQDYSNEGTITLEDAKSHRIIGTIPARLSGIGRWVEDQSCVVVVISETVAMGKSLSSHIRYISWNLETGAVAEIGAAAERDYQEYFKQFKPGDVRLSLAGYLGGTTILFKADSSTELDQIMAVDLKTARVEKRNVAPPDCTRWMTQRDDGLYEQGHECCEGSPRTFNVYDGATRKWIDRVAYQRENEPRRVETRIHTYPDRVEVEKLFDPRKLAAGPLVGKHYDLFKDAPSEAVTLGGVRFMRYQTPFESFYPHVQEGRLAFTASKDRRNLVLLDDDLYDVGTMHPQFPKLIDGQWAVLVQDGPSSHNNRYIIYGGQKVGSQYLNIMYMVGGKLAFRATGDKGDVFVWQGKEYCGGYEELVYALDVGDRPACIVKQAGKQFLVYDGKEYGKEFESVWPEVRLIDGEPAYEAQTGRERFITWKGRKLFDKFPIKVGKTECEEQRQAGKGMSVRCGNWQSGIFDYIHSIMSVGNAIAFEGSRSEDKYVVVGDREEGPYLNVELGLKDVNGKLAYVARSDRDHAFVVLGGKQQEVFDSIYGLSLTVIGNQLAYTATKDKKPYVVLGNRKIPIAEGNPWLRNFKDKLLISAKGTVYVQQ